MADDSWPGPNHNSRAVTSAELDLLLSAYVPDGLVGSPADLDIIFCDSSGRNVKVRSGRYGMLRGRLWYSGGSTLTLTIAANGSSDPRYDLVVMRYNRSTYDIRAFVITGNPGSGVPSPVNDGSYFDFPLGYVLVTPGVTNILASATKVTTYYLGGSLFTAKSDYLPPSTGLKIVRETDTGKVKISTGTGWITIWQDIAWSSRPAASGFTLPAGGYGARFKARNGFASMFAEVQRVGALAANSRAVFTTFDAQYAPAERLPVDLWVSADSGELTVSGGKVTVPYPRINAAIQANGTVTMDGHPALNSGALIIMPLVTWPIG
jgi:hypothetical protein